MARRNCAMCGGAFQTRHRTLTCEQCSTACVLCGRPHKTLGLCGAHHQRWLRAGKPPLAEFAAQGDRAGLAIRPCVVCGRDCHADRGKEYCSPECQLARDRERWRRDALRRYRADPARARRYRQITRARHGQRHDREKYRRLKADAPRLQKVRAQSRAGYHRHAARVLAERKQRLRARLEHMTPEELRAYWERQAASCRRWRQKLKRDPARYAQHQESQASYRRARARQKLAAEMLAVLSAASQEQAHAHGTD
jgi:hypothetical protein